jgi:RNA polymerase sigma factor (sigma-70 family)
VAISVNTNITFHFSIYTQFAFHHYCQMSVISQLNNGNEKVFKQVYDLLHRKVFRFFLKRNESHDTAKELTQKTFVKLWQSRHTLKEEFSIETQLFTIANSILVDHFRSVAHQNNIQTTIAENIPESENPVKTFEQVNYLNAAIATLPPVRKKVIELRLVHGFTNKEIAHHLSIQVKTVEDHITKALRHVRSIQL